MRKKLNAKQGVFLLVLILLFVIADYVKKDKPRNPENGSSAQIEQAYVNKKSDTQVEGDATVIKLLPDDNEGSRHQKFLIKVSGNITVLVAHNIDLAPRIQSLKKGDHISFYGEYEYTKKGGVLHWTHHDPGGRHPDGWIKHEGKVYR